MGILSKLIKDDVSLLSDELNTTRGFFTQHDNGQKGE